MSYNLINESDYYQLGFRTYDPDIGRFFAVDPLFEQNNLTPIHTPQSPLVSYA